MADLSGAPPANRRLPPAAVPTLTEVIDVFDVVDVIDQVDEVDAATPALDTPINEDQLVQRVLLEIQRHVDLMIEFRLREALAPVLARAAQNIVDEARAELSVTLRDVVGRAVAQEVARQRQR